jgi:hypothetical protein
MKANKPHGTTRVASLRRWLVIVPLLVLSLAALWFAWRWRRHTRPLKPLTAVVTLAGAGRQLNAKTLSDPFGIAVDDDDNIYVSDGWGGRI